MFDEQWPDDVKDSFEELVDGLEEEDDDVASVRRRQPDVVSIVDGGLHREDVELDNGTFSDGFSLIVDETWDILSCKEELMFDARRTQTKITET